MITSSFRLCWLLPIHQFYFCLILFTYRYFLYSCLFSCLYSSGPTDSAQGFSSSHLDLLWCESPCNVSDWRLRARCHQDSIGYNISGRLTPLRTLLAYKHGYRYVANEPLTDFSVSANLSARGSRRYQGFGSFWKEKNIWNKEMPEMCPRPTWYRAPVDFYSTGCPPGWRWCWHCINILFLRFFLNFIFIYWCPPGWKWCWHCTNTNHGIIDYD